MYRGGICLLERRGRERAKAFEMEELIMYWNFLWASFEYSIN